MDIRKAYNDAHDGWFKVNYKLTYAAGHYTPPLFPKVQTSNGLTNYILRFLTWRGHRATRVNTTGRRIGDKWIKGTTRRGSSDISSTIFGRSVMFEVKIGSDRPSAHQLAEQAKEEAAGGKYYFIKTPEQFLSIYELLVS